MQTATPARDEACAFDSQIETWVDDECTACMFKDLRLKRRFVALLSSIARTVGSSIPFACQDWANTKAAYRFLSNERVSEADILAGHFNATRDRFAATDGLALILHDTTEFSYQRENTDAIGVTKAINSGRDKDGRLRAHTVCGILMHSSLVVTPSGLPLGLAAIKLWTRKKFKGTRELKRFINPTRVPVEEKESYRWLENVRQSTCLLAAPERCVHIGDRESDIYELFCAAQDAGTLFLVRTCVDRLAGDGTYTVADAMKEVNLKGIHRIEVRDDKGEPDIAELEIRYARIRVLPPIGKQKRYPAQDLWLVRDHGRVVGAALQTPPYNLVVARPASDRALDALAEAIHEVRVRLPGVSAARPEVEVYADRWTARAGGRWHVRMAQGVYALRTVEPVASAPDSTGRRRGRVRCAVTRPTWPGWPNFWASAARPAVA